MGYSVLILVLVEYGLRLFPELKESEDERIRKQIISFLKEFEHDHYRSLDFSSWIAWLEKQGNADKVKQQQVIEIPFGAKDSELQEATYYIPDGYHAEINGNEVIIKKVEQKSIDKAEPKFKTGQWIVWQDKCYKVNYNGCGYELVDQNGLSTSLEYGTIDENAHLWTIQDAKDGDVLHSPSHRLIWIYNNCGQYYACVNMNYTTECIKTNGLISIPKDVCPATKDERTILFERMKEACYERSDKKN